jgi:hypothetical protein
MPPVKKPCSHFPWDVEGTILHREANHSSFNELLLREISRQHQVRPKVICMEGLYVFDPTQVTRQDIRQFLWAGLRELRVQTRAKGWKEEEERQLLSRMFDVFHDESESIWAALKAVSSSPAMGWKGRVAATPDVDTPESFVADEDLSVPLRMDFSKPLTLLDPDAELLAAFEP